MHTQQRSMYVCGIRIRSTPRSSSYSYVDLLSFWPPSLAAIVADLGRKCARSVPAAFKRKVDKSDSDDSDSDEGEDGKGKGKGSSDDSDSDGDEIGGAFNSSPETRCVGALLPAC